jgi:hypothetical protein
VRGIPVKWARDDAPGRGRPPRAAHPHPHAGGRRDGPRAAAPELPPGIFHESRFQAS